MSREPGTDPWIAVTCATELALTYLGGRTAGSDYRATCSGPQETSGDYRDVGDRPQETGAVHRGTETAEELHTQDDKFERQPDQLKPTKSVLVSKPKTMQDAVEIATELMDKKIQTFVERQTESKRKSMANANNHKGTGSGQKPTCYECGVQGYFKRECPKIKNNNNCGNQVRGGNAPAKVYAVGHAGTNPDSNIMTARAPYRLAPSKMKELSEQLKEGWIISNVHRLSGTEQTDSEESLSTPKDRRFV
ncbi:putative reverse transcriptase domain-containing protein [Tanacetum coccineum]